MVKGIQYGGRISSIRWKIFSTDVSHHQYGGGKIISTMEGTQSQGMDLAYIKTGISGVFFGVLNFENLYFWGTGHSCCIFGFSNKYCIFKRFMSSTVFFRPNPIHQVLQQTQLFIIIIS